MNTRRLFVGLSVLIVLGLVFGAGYVAYPLMHGVAIFGLPSAAPVAAEAQVDLKVFWEAWSLLEQDFYGEHPDQQSRVYGALHGMVNSFDDPYTVFVEPQPRELEQDKLRGSFGGIGAAIEFTNTIFVLHPLPDQPAIKAGVVDGDVLLRVDGTPITATMTTDDVVSLVRGPLGSEVTLVVRRSTASGAQELTFVIERAEIKTPSLEWRLLDDQPATADVGYMRQSIFSERSPAEMEQAISELAAAGATRFIWDVRGNPGGLVDSALAQADLWLDEGVILIQENADGSSQTFSASRGGAGVAYPLIVLIDAGSASASEIVAGALQDQERAQLVGEKSFGKGSVQLIYELTDQSSLHVTNSQWFTPNRRQISGSGLIPDVVVEAGTDPLPVAIAAFKQPK